MSATDSFTGTTPWQNDEPDCLVISCSDHRFERQTRELASHLGFKRPHTLQVPSGAVLALPLASVLNFLSKALDRIVERIVETKKVKDIVLVAHHDCGAYKAERVPLLASAVKQLFGRSVEDVQKQHLIDAARRLTLATRGVRVRAYYARVVNEGGQSRVAFDELPVR